MALFLGLLVCAVLGAGVAIGADSNTWGTAVAALAAALFLLIVQPRLARRTGHDDDSPDRRYVRP
ncbi:MAG: hypothetical protein LWW86_15765 [Micrococcales bacterium]|nr:hypothetical protein [Micrococcales bacterium]